MVAPRQSAYPVLAGKPPIPAATTIGPTGAATALVVIIAVAVPLAGLTASTATGRRPTRRRVRRSPGKHGGGGTVAVLLTAAVIGATVVGGHLVRVLLVVLGAIVHWSTGMLP